MVNETELQKLYNVVSNDGFDIGDFDQFKSKMSTPEDRGKFFTVAKNEGFDLGDSTEYQKRLTPTDTPKQTIPKYGSYDYDYVHSLDITNPIRRVFELGFNNLTPNEQEQFTSDYYKKLSDDPNTTRNFFGLDYDAFLNKLDEMGGEYRKKFQPNPVARGVQTFGRKVLEAKNLLDQASTFGAGKTTGQNLTAAAINGFTPFITVKDILRFAALNPSVLTTETNPKDIVTELGVKASEALPMLLSGGESGAVTKVGRKLISSPIATGLIAGGLGGAHSLLRDIQEERNTGIERDKWKVAGEAVGGALFGGLTQGIPDYIHSRAIQEPVKWMEFPGAYELSSRDAADELNRGAASPETIRELMDKIVTAIPKEGIGRQEYRPLAKDVVEQALQDLRESAYIPASKRAMAFAEVDPTVYPAFMDPTKNIGLGDDILSRAYRNLTTEQGYQIPHAESTVKNKVFPLFSSLPYKTAHNILSQGSSPVKTGEVYSELLEEIKPVRSEIELFNQAKNLDALKSAQEALQISDIENKTRIEYDIKSLEDQLKQLSPFGIFSEHNNPERIKQISDKLNAKRKLLKSYKSDPELLKAVKDAEKQYLGPNKDNELEAAYRETSAHVDKKKLEALSKKLSPRDLMTLREAAGSKPLNETIANYSESFTPENPFGDMSYKDVALTGKFLPTHYPEIQAGLMKDIAIKRSSQDLSERENLSKVLHKILADAYRTKVSFPSEVPGLGEGVFENGRWYPNEQVVSLITPEVDKKFAEIKSIKGMLESLADQPGRKRFAQGGILSKLLNSKVFGTPTSHSYVADYNNTKYRTAIDDYAAERNRLKLLGAIDKFAHPYVQLKQMQVRDYLDQLRGGGTYFNSPDTTIEDRFNSRRYK